MKYKDVWTRGPLQTEVKQLIVAIDHGLSFPGMPGLEKPMELLSNIAHNPIVDGVIANAGIYRQAQQCDINLSHLNRIITLDCVKMNGERLSAREMVLSPQEAMPYHPDCFKFFFNMYSDTQELMRNLKDIAKVAAEAKKLGVSTLAEIMFWNCDAFENEENRSRLLYEGCRMAFEVGIDALKIAAIATSEEINTIISAFGLPVFILGGSKSESEEAYLQSVANMKSMNICGLMLGRNVWQNPHMDRTLEGIYRVLNN